MKPIDLKEVFRSKNPRLARWIPGFLYRYLTKALGIDLVNQLLEKHGDKRGFEFANASIEMFNVTTEIIGEEHLPLDTRNVFVSNHPLGGFDGVLYLREIGEHYGRNYRVLVNDILMNLKNMEGYFVPINKHGAQAAENVRFIEELYASDSQIMTFPAGLVSRRKKGVIEDTEWKKSFVSKAVKHKRNVVPMHITGRCSGFFFRLSNFRKFLGIKANIEMLFLIKETFKHRNNHYKITIGKPIPYQTFDRSRKPLEWAQLVKAHCYRLPKDPSIEFDPNINTAK